MSCIAYLLHKPIVCFGVPVKWTLSALQQTLVVLGVLPVQGRMKKGRGGAGCTVGKGGGRWRR